jgi:uncharacterized membrane protein YgdD (TMEM256/DUF423 family)
VTPGRWLQLGAVLMALGVAAGAFGAHGLADKVDARDLQTWRTSASYHLIHALALVVLGATGRQGACCWLFLAGLLLFSGSLYTLVLSGQRWLGAVTPLGGVSFILGWVVLAVRAGGE